MDLAHNSPPRPRGRRPSSLVRIGLAIVAAVGWLLTVPFTAFELIGDGFGWAPVAFIPIAVLTSAAWWLHLRERDEQIGAGGATAGWFFIGSTALLGVAAFFWVMVAAAVLVSAAAYGIVLVVTRRRARRPRLELVTGLSLIAAGSVPAVFTLTAGIGNTDAWWMPAHFMLAVGIPLATLVSAAARFMDAEGSAVER